MQNFDNRLDTLSNVDIVQETPVVSVAHYNMTPNSPTTSLYMNENQPNSPSLSHPQVTSEYSFFYTPCNDFQMYRIVCKEVPLSFELVSRLINSIDNNSIQSNSVLYFIIYNQKLEKFIK